MNEIPLKDRQEVALGGAWFRIRLERNEKLINRNIEISKNRKIEKSKNRKIEQLNNRALLHSN